MGFKYSRFGVRYKREQCAPRVETATGQTANAGNVGSRDPLCCSREKKYAVLNLSNERKA